MINIDDFTEEQLIELNHRIVERLRYFEHIRTHTAMLKFKPGESVKFSTRDGREIVGRLIKYNKKTVTVVTNSGQKWNVSPGFLGRAASKRSAQGGSKVVSLKRRR